MKRGLALEAHIVIKNGLTMTEAEAARIAVKDLLHKEFSISHSTLEMESCGNQCQDEAGKMIPEH